MKKIAIYIKKGGVGKTLTAVTLAAALTKLNQRVLLIDLDKQRNSNILLGIDEKKYKYTIYNAFQRIIDEDDSIDNKLLVHQVQGIDVIVGSPKLILTNQLLQSIENHKYVLKKLLDEYKFENDYDYCIIDCNPSDVKLADNVLAAVDSIIVPMEMDFQSVQALDDVSIDIKRAKELNSKLKVEGILYNKVQAHTKICREYMEDIKNGYTDLRVFNQYIPLSIDCKNACDAGINLIQYKPQSKISVAYMNFAKELIGWC